MNFTSISWEDSLRSLQELLPTARSLSLEEIHLGAERAGLSPRWRKIGDWESLEDVEILELMGGTESTKGFGILLPPLCFYRRHMPFLVPVQQTLAFVRGFFTETGEAFFNGDTVLLFPSEQKVCLFHHDGMWATIELKAPTKAPAKPASS